MYGILRSRPMREKEEGRDALHIKKKRVQVLAAVTVVHS